MFACSCDIIYWLFMHFKAQLHLFFVERAYRVWGAIIFSCTVQKEMPYISYGIYYLRKMNGPFLFLLYCHRIVKNSTISKYLHIY